jgi:hypothetical protein
MPIAKDVTITLSPQMRIVAVVGGVAALGLAAFMLTLGRSSGAAQATLATIKPLHPVRKPGTHGSVGVKVKSVGKGKPKPVPLLPGLPAKLERALRRHELVVVSLFDPKARVDEISRGEASAAADVTHAGFVAINVLDQREAGPLMRKLGVLPDPAVLVYRRPGELVARFDGFADRDTVAQAVTNQSPAELARQATQTPTIATRRAAVVRLGAWAEQASEICARERAGAQKLHSGASRAELVAWWPTSIATEEELIAKLSGLAPPTAPHDRLLAQRLVDAAKQELAWEKRAFAAVKRKVPTAAERRRFLTAGDAAVARANRAAMAAGATGCAIFGT